MNEEKLTEEQRLHIEVDGIVSDLVDIAIEWDDPTDYPSLQVDKASNDIMELVFNYVDSRFLEMIGEDDEETHPDSKAGQHGLGEAERAVNGYKAYLRKKVKNFGEV